MLWGLNWDAISTDQDEIFTGIHYPVPTIKILTCFWLKLFSLWCQAANLGGAFTWTSDIYISSLLWCLGHTKNPSYSCLLCNRGCQGGWGCLGGREFVLISWRRFPIQHGMSCWAGLAEGQTTPCCSCWIMWKKSFYYLRSLIISFLLVVTRSQTLVLGERQVESDLFTDLSFFSPVFFQLYHVENFGFLLIFKQYLRYTSQEQNELYSHCWNEKKSTHKSHRLKGNLTWKDKNRRQISLGRGLICDPADFGAVCISCRASEPLGEEKQSAISSQGF